MLLAENELLETLLDVVDARVLVIEVAVLTNSVLVVLVEVSTLDNNEDELAVVPLENLSVCDVVMRIREDVEVICVDGAVTERHDVPVVRISVNVAVRLVILGVPRYVISD